MDSDTESAGQRRSLRDLATEKHIETVATAVITHYEEKLQAMKRKSQKSLEKALAVQARKLKRQDDEVTIDDYDVRKEEYTLIHEEAERTKQESDVQAKRKAKPGVKSIKSRPKQG